MRKINRLLKNEDFTRVLNTGRKHRDESFLVALVKNKENHLRAGISVSKKVGKAVVRVRVRRQIRAMIQEMDLTSDSIDLVIIPKSQYLKYGYDENLRRLRSTVKGLLDRSAK